MYWLISLGLMAAAFNLGGRVEHRRFRRQVAHLLDAEQRG